MSRGELSRGSGVDGKRLDISRPTPLGESDEVTVSVPADHHDLISQSCQAIEDFCRLRTCRMITRNDNQISVPNIWFGQHSGQGG